MIENHELEPTVADGLCRVCNQPFPQRKFEVLGLCLTITVCGKCGAEREEREKLAELQRQQNLHSAARKALDERWDRLCPKEFRLTTESGGKTVLARLELEQPQLATLMRWTGPKGLIVRGDTGTRKTRSMWRLMRRFHVEGKTVRAFTAAEFDRECRDAAGNFTLSEWFRRIEQCDAFFVDDLGKHPWTPATEATFFDVIDARTREDRPIFITTNDTGATLANRIAPERAEPLMRRLREYCDLLTFTAK